MPQPASSQNPKPPDAERMFLYAAIIGSLIFGASFCCFLFVLNNYQTGPGAQTPDAITNLESRLIPPDHPRQLVDFSLTDRTDATVTRADLDGKILVVDFLFTSCSLTCPAVNAQMTRIQQLTTNEPEVKLVSLTVDPRDDTPAVLEKYGARFGAETNRWLLLTGDRYTLYQLIGNSFLAQDSTGSFGYMPGNFAHIERIAVVDTHGQVRGYFDGLNQNTPVAVINEIKTLRSQN